MIIKILFAAILAFIIMKIGRKVLLIILKGALWIFSSIAKLISIIIDHIEVDNFLVNIDKYGNMVKPDKEEDLINHFSTVVNALSLEYLYLYSNNENSMEDLFYVLSAIHPIVLTSTQYLKLTNLMHSDEYTTSSEIMAKTLEIIELTESDLCLTKDEWIRLNKPIYGAYTKDEWDRFVEIIEAKNNGENN